MTILVYESLFYVTVMRQQNIFYIFFKCEALSLIMYMEFANCVLHCNTCLMPPRQSATQFTALGSGKLPQTAYFSL